VEPARGEKGAPVWPSVPPEVLMCFSSSRLGGGCSLVTGLSVKDIGAWSSELRGKRLGRWLVTGAAGWKAVGVMPAMALWILRWIVVFLVGVAAGLAAIYIDRWLRRWLRKRLGRAAPSAVQRRRRSGLFGAFFLLVFVPLAAILVPQVPPKVPHLVGQNIGQALEMARERGLSVSQKRQFMAHPDKGELAHQQPEGGARIRKGGTVEVVVSAGQYPDVVGRELDDASEALHEAGVRWIVDHAYTSDADRGKVLRQEPATGDSLVPEETRVQLVVGAGAFPTLTGMTQQEAMSALKNARLGWDIERSPSLDVEDGRVMAQEPQAGEGVRPGDIVTITVSSGPPPQNITISPVSGGDRTVHVSVSGFPVDSVVVAWLEMPGDAYYPQGSAEVETLVRFKTDLKLWYAVPPKRVWVTVHPRGQAPNNRTIFDTTGTNWLPVVQGSLVQQLGQGGYPVLGRSGPEPVQ